MWNIRATKALIIEHNDSNIVDGDGPLSGTCSQHHKSAKRVAMFHLILHIW